MSYYVRVFCSRKTVPPLRALLKWMTNELHQEASVTGVSRAKLDSTSWRGCGLIYDPGKEELRVECQRDTGPKSLCRQTVREQLNALEAVPDSKDKKRVVDRLKRTRFIVECEVYADYDHEEADTVREILDFFLTRNGGLIDEEDVGFFLVSDWHLPLRVRDDA
jgi:hypothetical protein